MFHVRMRCFMHERDALCTNGMPYVRGKAYVLRNSLLKKKSAFSGTASGSFGEI